jgi:hypothetical protein
MVLWKVEKSVLVPQKSYLLLSTHGVSLLAKGLIRPTYKGQL